MSKHSISDEASASPQTGGFAAGKTAGEIQRQAHTVTHSAGASTLGPDERHARISRAAYRRAETRGFQSGSELDDWLDAEREIDAEFND